MYIILNNLQPDHILRKTPLKELNVMYRNKNKKMWRSVYGFKIGTSTFNELGVVWIENCEFRGETEFFYQNGQPVFV